jgi:hypothetical protein
MNNNSKKDIQAQNKAQAASIKSKATPASNGRHAQAGREKGTAGQSNRAMKQQSK